MMDKLLAKVVQLAAARAETVAATLVEAARAELPKDVVVRPFDRQIIIEGKALARRALTEAALRGLAALAKAVLK